MNGENESIAEATGDRAGPDADREIRFGDFQFFPARRVLLRRGRNIRIGSRALALLAALAEQAGQIVPYEMLMRAGWPGATVDEANLRVQMATLRRLLDTDTDDASYISNAPGRGYCLTALATEKAPSAAAIAGKAPLGLISPLTRLIGREEAVADVVARLSDHRCVTVVGPGGIGKTRVAVETAWRLAEDPEMQVCFVDLAPLAAADPVMTTIAATLQLEEVPDIPLETQLAQWLKANPALLVLDNCEHVIDRTATLCEILLREAGTLKILATSREPFLIEGEVLVRLSGLGVPANDADLALLSEAAAYPALELMVERASSHAPRFEFADRDIADLARVCRRLDGIPLAIELAAARIEAIGLATLADHLDTHLAIPGEGRRSSLARHRTLAATLEWSFGLLSNEQKSLLVALSIFRGAFSMDGAMAIAPLQAETVLRGLSDLVTKSLVVVTRTGTAVRYRLLETTRAFCEGKRIERADADALARRHADYMLGFLAELRRHGAHAPAEPHAGAALHVADVRSAIEWCLDDRKDTRLGIRLIVDSGPMWLRLSMLSDYAHIIGHAIDLLWDEPGMEEADVIWLAPSLHKAWYNTMGISPRIFPMIVKAIEVARQRGDMNCTLDCLWALFGTRLTQGRYVEALDFAEQFAAVAGETGNPAQVGMAHRIVALSLWRNGELDKAVDHGRVALRANAGPQADIQLEMVYKQGVASRVNQSNLLWLTGKADAALALAHEAVTVGLNSDILGLSYGLAQTIIPLAFWVGDVEQAESLSALLLKLARENDLGYWLVWAKCHQSAAYRLRYGEPEPDDAIEQYWNTMDGLHRHIMATILPDLPIAWVTERDADERRQSPHWCTAELQRVAALQLLSAGDRDGARAQLEFAVDTAVSQGAIGWQLRAVTSLARLDLAEGRRREAENRLRPLLEAITEGGKTRDVADARDLIARGA